MRNSIIALTVLGALTGFASVSADAGSRGPATFYDQSGQFRGYAWCFQNALEVFDCSYFNRAQCEMSASTQRVICVPNPFALVQGYDPYAPVVNRKVRRQVY